MSIAELKGREREQRRAYIIDAAEKLFFSKGYDGVSMNDIAGELEMNKATLYNYFKNKDSLYFAVLQRGLVIMRDMLLTPVGKLNGLEKLTSMCRAFFAYCEQHPDHYRELCYARTRPFDMSQVENAMSQVTLANEIIAAMCAAISQGMADGSIRKGIDPLETAVFVMSSCENIARPGLVMEWALSGGRKTRAEYLEHSMGMLIYAISARRGKQ